MAKQSKKSGSSGSPKRRAAKAKAPAKAKSAPAPRTLAEQRAAEQFTRNVLVRGEACTPDAQGNLQPGCTHEVVSQEPGQLPQIKRRRFSIT
jgi:hypothetical protein